MNIKQAITITETINCFGDSVYQFLGKSYNFYQYNCSAGKELVKKVKAISAPVLIVHCEETINGLHIVIRPAVKVLQEMLDTDQELAKVSFGFNDSPGAEIAGKYGY